MKLARSLGRALCKGDRLLATLAVISNSIAKWPTDFDFKVAYTSSTNGTHSATSSCVQQTVHTCVRWIPNNWQTLFRQLNPKHFRSGRDALLSGPMPMSGIVFIPTSYIHLDIPQIKAWHTIESETDSGFFRNEISLTPSISPLQPTIPKLKCWVCGTHPWKETRPTKLASPNRRRQS